MKKKILGSLMALVVCALTLTNFSSTVSAENSGASTIKSLIGSRNFYVEYGYSADLIKRKLAYSAQALAVSGSKKMTYAISNVNFKLSPEWYTDGQNYFKYIDSKSKEVISFTEEDMNDPFINPSDGKVNAMKEFFKQPVIPGLAMFTDSENFTFVDSGNCVVDSKGSTANYDKYSQPVLNALNQEVKVRYFYVYYDAKNELLGVDSFIVAKDEDDAKVLSEIVRQKDLKKNIYGGGEHQFYRIVVAKFNNVLPKNFANLTEKTKFVKCWVGDMNELIEQRVPAESVQVKD